MPHLCSDEIILFLACFPFIGFYFQKLHLWWHGKIHHQEHKKLEEFVQQKCSVCLGDPCVLKGTPSNSYISGAHIIHE